MVMKSWCRLVIQVTSLDWQNNADWSLMFHFTQNIQVRQQWRWACNLWFCATHNMGGLATPFTNHQQHTNTMCTANHSASKYRNQTQKLEEKQSCGAHQTDNGRVGWDHQIHTSRLPRMIRNHMYTRLYQAPCQLCLTTSLLATDGAFHMRDHASSLLFSGEEPLYLVALFSPVCSYDIDNLFFPYHSDNLSIFPKKWECLMQRGSQTMPDSTTWTQRRFPVDRKNTSVSVWCFFFFPLFARITSAVLYTCQSLHVLCRNLRENHLTSANLPSDLFEGLINLGSMWVFFFCGPHFFSHQWILLNKLIDWVHFIILSTCSHQFVENVARLRQLCIPDI